MFIYEDLANVIARVREEHKFKDVVLTPEESSSDSNGIPSGLNTWGPGSISPIRDLSELVAEISEPLEGTPSDDSATLDSLDEISELERGDEWLACYLPYQYFGSDWGIYFHLQRCQSSILRNSAKFSEQVMTFGREFMRKTLHHEQFHFLVEYTAAIASDLKTDPFLARGGRSNSVYENHYKNPLNRETEEAFANAYALTRKDYELEGLSAKKKPELISILRSICDQCGPGYRDYIEIWLEYYPPSAQSHLRSNSRSAIALDLPPFRKALGTFTTKLALDQSISFPLNNPHSRYDVAGFWSIVDQKSNKAPSGLLKSVPTYIFEAEPQTQVGTNNQSPLIDFRIKTNTMRLKDFYAALARVYGLHYKEAGKHGKLIGDDGRKMNGWKRKGQKSCEVKPYMLAQVAAHLGVTKEALWESLGKV